MLKGKLLVTQAKRLIREGKDDLFLYELGSKEAFKKFAVFNDTNLNLIEGQEYEFDIHIETAGKGNRLTIASVK